jgi:hypothetical protein
LNCLQKGARPSDVCFAFNEGRKGSKWVCEGKGINSTRIGKKSDNTWLISKGYDHFTGFSVLLGRTVADGGDGDDCDDSSMDFGTLQWLCIAFLIAAFILSISICLVYHLVKKRERKSMLKNLSAQSRLAASATSTGLKQ